ncbi:MAG: hypothetical protein R3E89_19445 [Thiolinea sp.]
MLVERAWRNSRPLEQQQIAAFLTQPDATVFGEHAYWLRSRLLFWQQLPEEEQTTLAEAMRTAYQDSVMYNWPCSRCHSAGCGGAAGKPAKQWQQQQMGALLLQQLQVNQQIFDQALQSYRSPAMPWPVAFVTRVCVLRWRSAVAVCWRPIRSFCGGKP